ncbi:hypothetical protein BZL30_4497 [Mycobacterium kansasii]|uniref:Uncharacterized protein n=1 Tax=Mycobacterium kansasii TaxID=1768 RepID=A0A1V3X4W6_MYCKA|nr:hypothetical protein BZL30_4497 [Mycobacterium kansasii]
MVTSKRIMDVLFSLVWRLGFVVVDAPNSRRVVAVDSQIFLRGSQGV